ncbi:hypothetical protein EDD21DRAFT_380322 [Dissophora ornata]|nr:hypothetical protein EDD21DRAFT_380322 [Dissophora ornata]
MSSLPRILLLSSSLSLMHRFDFTILTLPQLSPPHSLQTLFWLLTRGLHKEEEKKPGKQLANNELNPSNCPDCSKERGHSFLLLPIDSLRTSPPFDSM